MTLSLAAAAAVELPFRSASVAPTCVDARLSRGGIDLPFTGPGVFSLSLCDTTGLLNSGNVE